MWKRVISPDVQPFDSLSLYDEKNKSMFLFELQPSPNVRFYAHVPNIAPFSLDEISSKIFNWTKQAFPMAEKCFVLSSKKLDTLSLQIYWPDFIIGDINKRMQIALSLESYLGIYVDFSVYSSGLTIPGCFKGKQTNMDYSFYWFEKSIDNMAPVFEDLLLTPHPEQVIDESKIDWTAIERYIKTSLRSDSVCIPPTITNKRKRTEISEQIINFDQLPPTVWQRLEQYTHFKGPFTLQSTLSSPNTWIINYNHERSFCTLGDKKHDGVGLMISFNQENCKMVYLCLASDCKLRSRSIIPHTSTPTDNVLSDNISVSRSIMNNDNFVPLDFQFLKQLCAQSPEDIVPYLNNYLCINLSSSNVYMKRFGFGPKWENCSSHNLSEILGGYEVEKGIPLFTYWKKSPSARLVREVTLFPKIPDDLPPDVLNLWYGFQKKPSNLSLEWGLILVVKMANEVLLYLL